MPAEFAGLRFAELIAPDAQWNWSGKVYSLLPDGRGDTRTRAECQSGRADMAPEKHPAESVCAGASCPGPRRAVGSRVRNPSAPSSETIAFQALMPGIAEELAYRGIAPALLLGLIRGRDVPDGTPWTVICIAAVPYALVHALSYSGGVAFSFDPSQAAYIYSGGIIYGWLRFSSGSPAFPVARTQPRKRCVSPDCALTRARMSFRNAGPPSRAG